MVDASNNGVINFNFGDKTITYITDIINKVTSIAFPEYFFSNAFIDMVICNIFDRSKSWQNYLASMKIYDN